MGGVICKSDGGKVKRGEKKRVVAVVGWEEMNGVEVL